MKNLIFFYILSCVLLLAACKKEEKKENPPSACNGKNFCMNVDGTQVTEDVQWTTINANRYRLIWESSSGTDYKNIEVDFYGSFATGVYTVEASPAASSTMKAAFQYYVKEGSTTRNIQGQSGTIEIKSISNDQLTGVFTITGSDGTNTNIKITDGNFVSVPKK